LTTVFDVEATNLLNSNTIDYTASPYKLKDNFKIHCAAFVDVDTKDIVTFDPKEIHKLPRYAKTLDHIVGHNIINYDLLALELGLGMDYSVGPDSWMGKDIKIEDTLVISKTLNPDRWFNHALKDWGRFLKFEKMDWRGEAVKLGLIDPKAPKGAEFLVYHPRMLDYVVQDALVNVRVYEWLLEEQGDWDWKDALELEHKTADIITRQEHRGFYFNEKLAQKHVVTLDGRMAKISDVVEPLIPAKSLTQAQIKEYSFPAKCFKQDGSTSAIFEKWIIKNNVEVIKDGHDKITAVVWAGTNYARIVGDGINPVAHPFCSGAVRDNLPATLKDGTHIKEWLVGLGWVPTVFKEKDLTVDSKKKKLSKEKYAASVERYVKQTKDSNFAKFRCEHLKVDSLGEMRAKLTNHDMKKPLKVLTNPQFTIDQEKTICPNLSRVEKTFPYAKEVVQWLTYNHRRNSILGGGLRFDEGEEAVNGFLSVDRIRVDSRIPTAADTMGASSGRFKHRVVANIPRATSLFGAEMRSLFGCDPSMWQLGSDFVSVEAMIEGHYTIPYKGGVQYAKALTGEKPNDLHSSNARKLNISRPDAKTLKYSCTYGAQPNKISKQMGWSISRARKVFNGFWEAASPLKDLKEKLEHYWLTKGEKRFILGLDGRKVPTRSKHSLLNNLFQSAGAITAKRQMVMFNEKLKDEGLLCDFFKDDWKNMVFVQQMIFYHK